MTFLESRGWIDSFGGKCYYLSIIPAEPPPHIITTRNESVVLRGIAFLHCRTQSVEPPKIHWVHNRSKTVGNSAKAVDWKGWGRGREGGRDDRFNVRILFGL